MQSYVAGETKKRPGTYFRYVNRGKNAGAGATSNAVAVPIQADWGPFDTVTVHESPNSIYSTYGQSGTVDAAIALLEGGASRVYCIRMNKSAKDSVGTAGAVGSVDIGTNLTIKAKYEGEKSVKVETRVKVADTSKEIVVYDGDSNVESFVFSIGDDVDEVANLIKAVSSSKYITAEKKDGGSDNVVTVKAATALTGGKNPSISTESYSDALVKLEPYNFNHIILDCTDTSKQSLLETWLDRVYKEGKLCIAVLGGDNSEKSMAQLTAASIGFDNKKIIYSGIWGRDEEGNIVDGYKMAALVAGAIANTPSNQSIVHSTVPGIVSIEPHTNAEYETAIFSGLLLASYSSSGIVWFDSGINTLINLETNDDDGWKKIRRVETRFEMLTRIDNATAPIVGRVNCDNDGVAQFIQKAQSVLNAMVAEGKLKSGAEIFEDPDMTRESDAAHFVIYVDDYDSMEKAYMKYAFRFNANS